MAFAPAASGRIIRGSGGAASAAGETCRIRTTLNRAAPNLEQKPCLFFFTHKTSQRLILDKGYGNCRQNQYEAIP